MANGIRPGRMEGKVAIVTGAARGTGAAIARLFAEEGAQVVIADVRDELGKAVASEIAGVAIRGDVSDPEHSTEAVRKTIEQFGGFGDDVVIEDGMVRVPNAPGLGVETKSELYNTVLKPLAQG